MSGLSNETLKSVRKYGGKVDKLARAKYGISGAALLAKLVMGESRDNAKAVSSAGARGKAQFMPGTRGEVMKKYGIDPWSGKSDDAVAAAVHHLNGDLGHNKGLEGYNPGDAVNYRKYILAQKVGDVHGGSRPASSPRSTPARTTTIVTPAKSTTKTDDTSALVDALLSRSRSGGKGSLLKAYEANIATGAYTTTTDTPAKTTTKTTPGSTVAPSSGPRPTTLKGGGGYAGTKKPADTLRDIGTQLGLQVTSSKRNNTNPHSGSRSDHDNGNKDAFAYDLSNGSSPTPQMDRAAYRIARQLGIKDYKMGTPIMKSVQVGKFRYQLIYRGTGAAFGGNHMNHVHIGVKRAG